MVWQPVIEVGSPRLLISCFGVTLEDVFSEPWRYSVHECGRLTWIYEYIREKIQPLCPSFAPIRSSGSVSYRQSHEILVLDEVMVGAYYETCIGTCRL